MNEVLKVWVPLLYDTVKRGDGKEYGGVIHVRDATTKTEGVGISLKHGANGNLESMNIMWSPDTGKPPQYIEIKDPSRPDLEVMTFEVVDL